MEELLGLWALALTMLMSLAIVTWFCCSIAESIMKMRQRQRKHRCKALTAAAKTVDPIAGGNHIVVGNCRSASQQNLYEKLSILAPSTGSTVLNTAVRGRTSA